MYCFLFGIRMHKSKKILINKKLIFILDRTLTIINLTHEDSGEYKCTGRSPTASSPTARRDIKIHQPGEVYISNFTVHGHTHIKLRPGDSEVKVGQQSILLALSHLNLYVIKVNNT